MQGSSRDRVTFDLRGLGPRLHARAQAQKITTAALVRSAVTTMLAEPPDGSEDTSTGDAAERDAPLVKITLRLPVAHARAIARRARAMQLSQGAWLARLVDGNTPDPTPTDHGQAVAALLKSTDQLAVLSTDLNAFMRLLGRVPSSELERYRASIQSVVGDVRRHLALASTLAAEIRPARRGR